SGWTRWKAGPHALKPAPPFSRTLVMHAATPEPGVAGTKKGTQVRFFSNGHQIRMDKGPNGTIKKFPARKNNDFMIKVLRPRRSLPRSSRRSIAVPRSGFGGYQAATLPFFSLNLVSGHLATSAE